MKRNINFCRAMSKLINYLAYNLGEHLVHCVKAINQLSGETFKVRSKNDMDSKFRTQCKKQSEYSRKTKQYAT